MDEFECVYVRILTTKPGSDQQEEIIIDQVPREFAQFTQELAHKGLPWIQTEIEYENEREQMMPLRSKEDYMSALACINSQALVLNAVIKTHTPMPALSSAESGPGRDWRCSRCSKLNDGSAPICTICGKPSGISTNMTRSLPPPKLNADPQLLDTLTIKVPARNEKWKCTVCMMMNLSTHQVCMTCQAPRRG